VWLDRASCPLPRLCRWWRGHEKGEACEGEGKQDADSKRGRQAVHQLNSGFPKLLHLAIALLCTHTTISHLHHPYHTTRITGRHPITAPQHLLSALLRLLCPSSFFQPASPLPYISIIHPAMTSTRRVPPLLPVLVLSLALLLLLSTTTLAFVALPLRSSCSNVGLRRPHAAAAAAAAVGPRAAAAAAGGPLLCAHHEHDHHHHEEVAEAQAPKVRFPSFHPSSLPPSLLPLPPSALSQPPPSSPLHSTLLPQNPPQSDRIRKRDVLFARLPAPWARFRQQRKVVAALQDKKEEDEEGREGEGKMVELFKASGAVLLAAIGPNPWDRQVVALPPSLPPSLPPYRGIGINPTPPTALAMWGPYVGTMFFLMQELKNILLTLLLPPSLPPPLPHLQRHGHQSYSSQRFSNVGSLRRDAPLPHLWHEGARAAEAFFVRSAEEEEAGKEGYGGREGGRGVLFAPLE